MSPLYYSVRIYIQFNVNSKAPAQTAKLKGLSKMITSHFYNVIRLLEHLTEKDTLILAFNESAKLLPYVISSRKAAKLYLKVQYTFQMFGVEYSHVFRHVLSSGLPLQMKFE